VSAAIRCPLLVDLDGLIIIVVISSIGQKKLVVMSQSSPHIEAILGRTLVLLKSKSASGTVASRPLHIVRSLECCAFRSA
jgi:hypothetical protein